MSPLLHLQIEHLEVTSIDSKSITESDLPTFPGETLALRSQYASEVRKLSSSSSAITRFSIRFIRTSNASSLKNVDYCQHLVWFSVAIELNSRINRRQFERRWVCLEHVQIQIICVLAHREEDEDARHFQITTVNCTISKYNCCDNLFSFGCNCNVRVWSTESRCCKKIVVQLWLYYYLVATSSKQPCLCNCLLSASRAMAFASWS